MRTRRTAGRGVIDVGGHVDAGAPARHDAEEARWEFTQLRRLLRASEPGSKAEAVSGAIMAEANRIEARRLRPAEQVVELRAFVVSLGLAASAGRIARSARDRVAA